MRPIFVLLCAALLFASLFGSAHPGGSAGATHLGDIHASSQLQDVLCGEGFGHMACQPAVVGSHDVPDFMAPAEPSRFEIMPLTASGRSSPPNTPPPRQHS
jgi:hypothetical protein